MVSCHVALTTKECLSSWLHMSYIVFVCLIIQVNQYSTWTPNGTTIGIENGKWLLVLIVP